MSRFFDVADTGDGKQKGRSYRSLLQNDSNNKPAHRESVFLCSSVYRSYAAEVAQGSWGGNPIAQRTSVARELVHFGQFNF